MKWLHWLRSKEDGALQNDMWLCAFVASLVIPYALVFNRMAMEISSLLVVMLFLLHSALRKEWGWLHDPLVRIGLLTWLWLMGPVSVFAIEPAASFKVAVMWGRFIILYAALRHWVYIERNALRAVCATLVALLGFIVVDTLWQHLYDTSLTGHMKSVNGRLTGPFDNVKVGIFLAKLSLPVVALCIFFSGQVRSAKGKLTTAALLLGCLATIALAGERTAFFSVLLGLIIIGGCIAIAEPRFRRPVLALFLVLVVGISGVFASQPWVQQRAYECYQTLLNLGNSPYGLLFQAGYMVGVDHPVAGVGIKGFRLAYPLLPAPINSIDGATHPHNPYIEWFAEAGLVGLLLFVGFVVAAAIQALRLFKSVQGYSRLLPAAGLAILTVHFFPLMATQSSYSNWPSMLLWYSLSLAFASFNLAKKN